MLDPKTHKVLITVIFTATLLTALLGVMSWGLLKSRNDLAQVKEAQTQEAHFLLATVDFATEQQRLALFIRDIVFEEWGRIKYKGNYDKAFSIASAIVKEATKYPYKTETPTQFLDMQRMNVDQKEM